MSSYGFPAGTPEYYRAWKAANRDKIAAWNAAAYKANPQKFRERDRAYAATPEGRDSSRRRSARHNKKRGIQHRRWRLQKHFGLTLEQYEAMLQAQGGKCAICRSETVKHKTAKYFCVDHCHSTNRVRGLLCSHCNVGLGRFEDNPSALIAAANYLLRHQEIREVS